jgi:hypothetical protein
MKLKQQEGHYIYRIVDNRTNEIVPCYFQFGGDIYDFNSVKEARESNCHGVFKDKDKYRIAKFKVIEELECDNCDPATEDELIEITKEKDKDKAIDKIYQELISRIDFIGMNPLQAFGLQCDAKIQATIEYAIKSASVKSSHTMTE